MLRQIATNVMVATCAASILAAAALAQPTPESTVEPAATMTPETTSLPEAPFGLRWLASRREIAEMGISLKNPMATEFGESYPVAELPKELVDLEYTVLSFGYDDHLIRITAVGEGFQNDDDGSRIKARYQELEELLQRKYGAGRPQVHTEKDFDGKRFAMGLGNKKNWMYTEFFPRDMRIELSALVDGWRTRWRIIFEYLPGMERLQHQRKRAEDQAL
jgi:hypothetical protein